MANNKDDEETLLDVDLSVEETAALRKVAARYGVSIETLVKRLVLNKLTPEEDAQVRDEIHAELAKLKPKSKPPLLS
jgi:transposase